MKIVRILITLGVVLIFGLSFAMNSQPADPGQVVSIDQMIDSSIKPVADKALEIVFYPVTIVHGKTGTYFFFGKTTLTPEDGVTVKEIPLIIPWMLLISVFTSFYYGFINLRLFPLVVNLLRGKHNSEEGHGEISNWQALSTSLSSTVGLGNIAGVAVAVSIGGPGATFWMILMGFLGMSTKFLECALGVKYRLIDEKGEASGGPMYYVEERFKHLNLPILGKALGILFAFCCIGGAIGGGNMFQSNQTYKMFQRVAGEGSVFADQGWTFGVILAVLVGMAIIGGIKEIAKISEKIFPLMGGLYVMACLTIILGNIGHLGDAVSSILTGAFSAEGVAGGMLGVMVAGVQRAVFSNEAGVGSAAITYAAVRSDNHIAQGLIAMLNPFIDTVVICTMTALAIAVTGVYTGGNGVEGITLTASAFATLGDWTIYWLALTVFLFAYSTLIAWYYLGEKGFTYIYGPGKNKVLAFKVFYCLCVIAGCAMELSNIINFTDALFFAMTVPNIIALYMFAPEIKRDLAKYLIDLKTGQE